jgi:hypothetical protein
MSESAGTWDVAHLSDAALEALLLGRGDPTDALVGALAALRGMPQQWAPEPSAALAAMLATGLVGEEISRPRRRARIVISVVAGSTTLALSGVAAAHDALPGPAQTVVTDIVNNLTPFHLDRRDGAMRPPPVAPSPTATAPPPLAQSGTATVGRSDGQIGDPGSDARSGDEDGAGTGSGDPGGSAASGQSSGSDGAGSGDDSDAGGSVSDSDDRSSGSESGDAGDSDGGSASSSDESSDGDGGSPGSSDDNVGAESDRGDGGSSDSGSDGANGSDD